MSLLSDHNFLEQYYQHEFDNGLNQETFLYVKQQNEHWAWTHPGRAAPARLGHRDRVAAARRRLPPRPEVLRPVHVQRPRQRRLRPAAARRGARRSPTSPTDAATDTGRFDLFQELSLPFSAGPVKLVPYGVLDLTYYTQDLTGDDQGRIYGGGGLRASMPALAALPGCRERAVQPERHLSQDRAVGATTSSPTATCA